MGKFLKLDLINSLILYIKDIVFLKICSTHFIKAVTNKIKDSIRDPKIIFVLKRYFAKLIFCSDFGLFVKLAKCVDMLLIQKDQRKAEILKEYLDQVDIQTAVEPLPSVLNELEFSASTKLYEKSPFYQQVVRGKKTDSETNEISTNSNDFFSPELSKYFRKKLLPLAPLWSSFVRNRESNAVIESYFRFLKKDLLGYKLKQKPGRVVSALNRFLEGKLTEVAFGMEKKPSRKGEILKIPVEKWKSKTKSKNIFSDILIRKPFYFVNLVISKADIQSLNLVNRGS